MGGTDLIAAVVLLISVGNPIIYPLCGILAIKGGMSFL